MSDEQTRPTPAGGRRRKGRNVPGCVAVLVALAVVVGGFYLAATKGVGYLQDQFSGGEDFEGPGTGRVVFEVQEGDSSTVICRNLKDAVVVASVDACIEAATANPEASGIQVGFYRLKKEMAAEDAIDVLIDPDNIMQNTVTIPEGLRVVDIVAILAKETDYSAAQFERVLDRPEQLGLPQFAEGNPEGYLFPSTYAFGPKESPKSMLTTMVDRWEQAANDVDLKSSAAELGYSPAEVMIVASLVEAEARREQDRGKVARVIYNRLENPDTAGTNGLLQIDAAVNYGLDQKLGVTLTEEQKAVDTPYNTYLHPGLPPTPIEAPGDAAIEAATSPSEGDWYYYVTVNLRTGETKFAETYDEFLGYKAELTRYCETSDAC